MIKILTVIPLPVMILIVGVFALIIVVCSLNLLAIRKEKPEPPKVKDGEPPTIIKAEPKKKKETNDSSSNGGFRWLLGLVLLALVWWYWVPIKEHFVPRTVEKRSTEITERKKSVEEVKKEKPVEVKKEKLETNNVWLLKWQKPKNVGWGYPNIPQEDFEIYVIKAEVTQIKFDILSVDKTPGNQTHCELIRGESYWDWEGRYKNDKTRETGSIFLKRRQIDGKVEYFGKVSLAGYYNEWVDIVIFQKR